MKKARNRMSRELSNIDMSASSISPYFHQQDLGDPTSRVFAQKIGSPFGGCLTLVYGVVVLILLITRFFMMLEGDFDSSNSNYELVRKTDIQSLKKNFNLRFEIRNSGMVPGVLEKHGLKNKDGSFNQTALD